MGINGLKDKLNWKFWKIFPREKKNFSQLFHKYFKKNTYLPKACGKLLCITKFYITHKKNRIKINFSYKLFDH